MERRVRILEIIEIRSVRENIFEKINLADLIQSAKTDIKPGEIKLYRHKHIDSDFSLHLFYESDPDMSKLNTFGLHLSSLLKEWGLINHSVWIEEKSIPYNKEEET
jgi:hypothetical protein